MSLEAKLQDAMLEAYERAGRKAGYWGNYFRRSVLRNGGLVTAKRMLRPAKGARIQMGFQVLVDAGCADLSVEALVLHRRFAPLFTKEELTEARRRLDTVPDDARRRRVPVENLFPEAMPDGRTYREGAVRRILVNAYERDPRAREACLRRHGRRCKVCGLSFEKRYGSIGRDFIHVHHLKPVAARRRTYRIDPVKDLVPVCPNCHAMLHTSHPPLSVAELKQALADATG